MDKQIPLRTLVREILPCLQAADNLAKLTLKPTLAASSELEQQQRQKLHDDYLQKLSRIRMNLAPLLSRHASEVRAIHNNRGIPGRSGTIVTVNDQQLRLLNSVHTVYARILELRNHRDCRGRIAIKESA